MAYVPVGQEDDEEQKRKAAGLGTPEGGTFGDTTPSSTPTKTSFVNVMDYLNKNPDASAQLGETAATKLNQQRTDAQAAATDTQSKFGQALTSGSKTLDQGLLDRAFADPSQFVGNPDDLAKFTAMRDASYSGPQSLQATDSFAPTQSKIAGLGTTATSLGTEEGRNALLQGFSPKPTHGKTVLNQLLLQGDDTAAQKVTAAAGTFKDVEDQWKQFMEAAPGQVAAARAGTEATKNATQQGLQGATSAFAKQLQGQTQKATNERDAFNLNAQNIDKLIAEGGFRLNQQQLDSLGASDAYPYLAKLHDFNTGGSRSLDYYGRPVQLSNYSYGGQANTNIPTAASTATPEQYAKEAALQQLSGTDQGLPDEAATPYASNGKLPTILYKDAFNKAGSDLRKQDEQWLAGPGYTPPPGDLTDWVNQRLTANSRLDTTQKAFDEVANNLGGLSPDQKAKWLQDRFGHSTYDPKYDYYNNPSSAEAQPGPGMNTTPPAGWDPAQPPPYPQPTSNPPAYLIYPTWDPYTGQWGGVRLQGGGGGGGHAIF